MQVLPSTAGEDKYYLFNKTHELSERNATEWHRSPHDYFCLKPMALTHSYCIATGLYINYMIEMYILDETSALPETCNN